MENNPNKWFDAAAGAKPILAVEDIEAILNKANNKVFSKSIDNYIKIMAAIVFVISILWFWLNIPSEERKQIESKGDDIPVRSDIPQMKTKLETPKSEVVINRSKSIEHYYLTNDSVDLLKDSQVGNYPNDLFISGIDGATVISIKSHAIDDFQNRILYLNERELEKLGLIFTEGSYNHYYKTYSHANKIKATQLISYKDSFYFIKGYPGRNYFIKPWENDFHPMFLTDSLGNNQQNFHFQDCPVNMSFSIFVDSLRNDFLKSYKNLLPVAIRSSKNGKLYILWYEPSNVFFKCVSNRTKVLIDSYQFYEGQKMRNDFSK
jgi:hypothetical protein